ncbi:MAG: alpha-glucosidase C-terminal domain-containing protein, partial [Clostridia bacterium]|nr:alpha-glucosidase C-terminal domain-containing protein [Clostridia bacterium]
YAEKNAYPLAYLRTYDDEQILIVLNPSDREVSFHCSFIPVETIYRMGGNVSCHDETFTIAPQTAAFLKVQHNQ